MGSPFRDSRGEGLADYHFKFVVLANGAIFIFYTFFRILMVFKLVFFDQEFNGVFHFKQSGLSQYTLGRVAFPTLLLVGLLQLSRCLWRGRTSEVTHRFFQSLFRVRRRPLGLYGLVVIGILETLSLVPHFTLLVENLSTQYAFTDVDSYTGMVATIYRGDYNPEHGGGLAFGKYYILNIPILLLTFLLGLGQLVPAQNLVVTGLVFLSILNMTFVFRNLAFRERLRWIEEAALLLFALIPTILILRLVIFRDYFNYDGFLQVYYNGFWGALASSYLVTCILLVVSYLLRKVPLDWGRTLPIFLVVSAFMSFSVHDYFNMSLFLLPATGMVLALLLSRKSSHSETLRAGVLLLAFLLMIYGSFLALDIMPRYSLDPVTKLHLIIGGVGAFWGVAVVINRLFNNLLLKSFAYLRSEAIIFVFAFPFFWWLDKSGDPGRIELLGYQIKLCMTRLYFLYMLLYALVFSYLTFLPLQILWRRKPFRSWFAVLVIGLLIGSLGISRSYARHNSLLFHYPSFYPEERRITDRSNLYAFDENGIKVTYNQYLIDVIGYFIENDVRDLYYWIVSRTPSQGVYEHILVQRMLMARGHEVEGLTIKDFAPGEEDQIPLWAQIPLSGTTVRDYDGFVENIFAIEKETRHREERFKNRYLILDNSFPAPRLAEMERSGLFRRVYENRLYKIYRVGQVEEQGDNTPPVEEETEQMISDGYLTQVVDWFRADWFRQGITSGVRHWIILQPFPQKQLDRDLTQKALISLGHQVARMKETSQMSIEEFAEEIFNWEQMSREGEECSEIEDRYVIVDSDFPSDHLMEMVGSGLFRKIYENRFYGIYRMEYFKYR